MERNKPVILGLGNPGEKYESTRHNVGEKFIRFIYEKVFDVQSDKNWWDVRRGIVMAKNENYDLVLSEKYFMNESGKIIEDLMYLGEELNNLYVVHDDLDLKLGEYRIQFGKGPELHGGINDIEKVIGKDFWRIRIGVDNRGTPRMAGDEYVLQKFTDEEIIILKNVFGKIFEELMSNEYNPRQ